VKKVDTYNIVEQELFRDVAKLIDDTRKSVAYAVNSALTYMYWQIGKRINDEILQHERAEYGSQIVASLSRQLQGVYGKGFEEKSLRRMMQFSSVFQDEAIVVSLIRQLSWTHIIALLPLKDPLQREFYVEMCKLERWSVRTLRQKIDGMLYERTAISRKDNVPQGQQFINRRFQPTEKTENILHKVPQGRNFALKVSSLRDFGGRSFCPFRRLKPPVNRVLSLRDFAANKQVGQFAFDTTININVPIVA